MINISIDYFGNAVSNISKIYILTSQGFTQYKWKDKDSINNKAGNRKDNINKKATSNYHDIYLSVVTSRRPQSGRSAVGDSYHPAQAQRQKLRGRQHAAPGTAGPLLVDSKPGNDNIA